VALLLGSACASSNSSWRDVLDGRFAPHTVGPATSTTPAVPWVPPPDVEAAAAKAAASSTAVALPTGVTAGGTVTLSQIIDTALTNNPTTRTAWLEAREAEATLGSARSAYLPEIDLGASLSHSSASTVGGTGTTSGSQTRFSPTLSLTYLLFDFGGRDAVVEEARQTLIAANYTHNQAIQDVILRAQQAYYDYLDAKALLGAQRATIEERQTELTIADARHSAGVATIADVLQARTALSQARLTLETIEGNLRTLEGTLSTVMGVPANTRFEIGELPLEVPAQKVMQHVDQLIADAAASRPQLAAQRAFAQRAQARVREIRAQGLPSITLDSSTGASVGIGGGGRTVYPYSAGLSLRFPLFTGGRNTYDVRAAELGAQVAAENVRDVQQQIYLQVWTSYYGLETATRRLATSRDLLNDARQSVDVASGRYKAGVGTILDLLTAEAALENARAQEVQARADWFIAIAQLAHDTGTLAPVNGDVR
jgi:TolC family type I secretion outer membrane protein